MEKAYKLEFRNERPGSLSANCCGCSKTESLHSFGPALKPHYLIHYILSGKGILQIGGKEYQLKSGYGFLITPDELAFYQADEKDPWTYVWIGFAGTKAAEYVENIGLSVSSPVFRSDQSDELYRIVHDMMEHNTFGITDDLRRNGLLHMFLSVISESAELSARSDNDRANQYVRKAVEFIQANYCNPIKVTDVADYVCINRSYLYTLFHNTIQMSPQQFLTAYRITKAMELLQVTQLPIEGIAISCGYQDPLVFSKAFRQMKGISPSAYRKELLSGTKRRDKEQLRQVEAFLQDVHINN